MASNRLQRAVSQVLRVQAREAEQVFRDALTAGRPDLGEGRIQAPPRLERQAERFGGGYRSRTAADYDWFYGLSRAEQARIRENWFTAGPGLSPDELEDMGLPVREWLALTRGIDAARAVQTGRQLQTDRYGGRDPVAFLKVGEPADEGTPYRPDEHNGERVQFFTDENGVVHPIRASYEHRASGLARAVPADYGDDEPF